MPRKTLEDFDGDYQEFANYLESAQCMQDDGIDIYADEKGNIYTPTEGDWTLGHGHDNVFDPKPERKPEDPESYGRTWYNKWLKYSFEIILSQEENMLLNSRSEEPKKIMIKK